MQDVQNETEPQMRKGIAKRETGSWLWDVGKGNTVNSLLKYPMRIRWAKAESKFEFESDSESKLVSTAMCFINDDNSLWLFISIVRRRSGRLFPITVAQDANHYSYKHTQTHTNIIRNLCNLFDRVRFINSPSTFLRNFLSGKILMVN